MRLLLVGGKLPKSYKVFVLPEKTTVLSCSLGSAVVCPGPQGGIQPTGNVFYLFKKDPTAPDPGPYPQMTGKDLKLTQYFKVVATPGDGWRTFTHVEGPGKQNYINADHVPVDGKYPVGAWKAGDIIRRCFLWNEPSLVRSPLPSIGRMKTLRP